MLSKHGGVLVALLGLLVGLVACAAPGAAPNEETITIFAASSLTNAFEDLAAQYRAAHPDTALLLNFGASSQLATQLLGGARADLFASADTVQIERVAAAGLLAGEPTRFASNALVLIAPADNPAGVTGLASLAQPGLKFVTAGPQVPIGRYTRDVLASAQAAGDFPAGWEQAILENVVSEEANVRQVLTKVQLGEADAAIVYQSDVTPNVQDALQLFSIPDAYNVRAQYPLALLRDAPNRTGANSFMAWVLSAEGQAILAKWGFGPP